MCSVHFPFLYTYVVTALKSGLPSAITHKVNRVHYIKFVHVALLSAYCMNLQLWNSWNIDDGTRSTIL